MGCGCGGTKVQPTQYEVTLPTGAVKTTDSEVQARQWVARYGGGLIKEKKA